MLAGSLINRQRLSTVSAVIVSKNYFQTKLVVSSLALVVSRPNRMFGSCEQFRILIGRKFVLQCPFECDEMYFRQLKIHSNRLRNGT